ncbi:hypothetical protein H5410_015320 [Solanum commersonii]|uniref:NB-ARC domain-containing protein n=1 Tax=Solanum commersonii TaxID=4109 RepID=A0A9J5ZTI1_SOLCO|nr:hypothetical protein H5410_015320 [Solanum commersonii]
MLFQDHFSTHQLNPLELDVLYTCISKLMKESRSIELEGFVKKILKTSKDSSTSSDSSPTTHGRQLLDDTSGVVNDYWVLREILQQVTGSEGNKSEDDLAEKLRRALLDKRYLIVLDDVWDIATGEMLIACFPKMMKVMQLSFDHLPYHLKSLLRYFARSQKNKQTPVSKLMQLGMAEGFVDHDIPSKSNLEEATQSYLDALISSSLIMVDHIPSKKRTWPFSDMIKNLETLLIRTQYSTIVLLPRILKLSKLKHISIDNRSSFFENEEDADNIMHQRSRILEVENSKLTTLSQVQISYSKGTNDALEKFPNLQHLDCVIEELTDPPSHNDWFPKFNVLNKLESLIARYGDDSELIDQIPPPNEYHFPTSLKMLRLYGFLLRPALLSAIVALPELEILVLNTSDFNEDKRDASEDIYQSLNTLHLENTNYENGKYLKSIHVVQSKRELGDSAMKMRKDVEAYTGENILHVHLSYEYCALGYEEESK